MHHCLVFLRNVCDRIFHWFVFCVSNICRDYFRNSSVWDDKIVFFWEIVQLVVVLFAAESILFVVVCISFFWLSCLEAPLWTNIVMTVERVFKRNFTCLTQLFDCFFPILFIMHPQFFLSWRAYALVHPHWWAQILLTMENMWLATTFTWWEVPTRKYGSGISSSSFPLDDFKTWPQAPLDRCLSTACIVLSSPAKMTSMIKIDYIMHPLPSS